MREDARHEYERTGEVAVFRPGDVASIESERGYRGLNALQRWSQGWPAWAQGVAGWLQRLNLDLTSYSTGQVVGLAVGSAAAVGRLVVALEPTPEERLPDPVERAIAVLPKDKRKQARRAARDVRRGAGDVATRAAETRDSLTEAATDAASAARVNVGRTLAALGSAVASSGATIAEGGEPETAPAPQARLSRRELQRQAKQDRKDAEAARRRAARQGRGRGQAVREGAANVGESIGGALSAAGSALAGAGSAVVERVKPEEKSPMENVKDMVQDRFASTRRGKMTRRGRRKLEKQIERLDKQRQQLQKQAGRRIQDVREQIAPPPTPAERVMATGSNLGKTLAAFGAATAAAASPLRDTATQLAQATRERASDLSERVREGYAPQVADAAGRAGTRVSELASTGVSASRAALRDAAKSDAVERAGELADQAGQATRRGGTLVATAASRAASATGYATKETLLALTWASALGGLVYYAFLNDEQRAKIASTATSLYEQAQELIRDFQGYDEEF